MFPSYFSPSPCLHTLPLFRFFPRILIKLLHCCSLFSGFSKLWLPLSSFLLHWWLNTLEADKYVYCIWSNKSLPELWGNLTAIINLSPFGPKRIRSSDYTLKTLRGSDGSVDALPHHGPRMLMMKDGKRKRLFPLRQSLPSGLRCAASPATPHSAAGDNKAFFSRHCPYIKTVTVKKLYIYIL